MKVIKVKNTKISKNVFANDNKNFRDFDYDV